MADSFHVDVTAIRLLADRFRESGGNLGPALQKGMLTGVTKLANYIVQNKLSGQVLHIRSGRLAQSVLHPSPGPSSGTSVTYLIGGVFYGKVHEFGASIKINSPVNMPGIGWRYLKTVQIPARPWLNPSIEEKMPEIAADVINAVKEAIEI